MEKLIGKLVWAWNEDKRFAAIGTLVDYSLDTIYPYSVVIDRSGCGLDYLNIEPIKRDEVQFVEDTE